MEMESKKEGKSVRLIRGMIRLALAGSLILPGLLSLPQIWGLKLYAVTSGSMVPEIPVGAAVYVAPAAKEQLKEGDVITFSLGAEGMTATHRIIRILREGGFETKGDANEQPDAKPVKYEQIQGRVCAAIPYLGYAGILLGNLWGKAAAASWVLWLLAMDGIAGQIQVFKKKKEMKRIERKMEKKAGCVGRRTGIGSCGSRDNRSIFDTFAGYAEEYHNGRQNRCDGGRAGLETGERNGTGAGQ